MLVLPQRSTELSLQVLLLLVLVLQCSHILALASSKDLSTNNMACRDESMYEDARAFNEYASAAVDLSNAHVTKEGLLTGSKSSDERLQAFDTLDTHSFHVALHSGSIGSRH